MNLNGARFLVVGGSGVLGAEFTRQLRAQGAEVLATATTNDSAAKIPAVAEVRLLLNYQDAQSVETLTDYLRGSTTLDGIINAAGVVGFGPASETAPETTAQLFAINALGPIQLFTALHPMLVQSKLSGKEPVVVNISGVVAEQPMPNLAAYSASKTAIAGFLDAVTREWRREGIRVLNTYPGHTETGLASRAISGVAPQFPQGMSAEHVVSRIIKGIVEDEKTLPSSEF
jgi:cyclic-di-GMP-binding biofilm dispersal mediator protein